MSRKVRWSHLGLGLLIAVTSAGLTSPQDSFKVVVHPSNPVRTIVRAELARIFLRSSTKWSDGTAIQPVDQSAVSPTREVFSTRVLAMTVGKTIGYWQQQVYSGRLTPPPIMSSDQDVLRFVGANPSAVGYVSLASDAANVKVVDVQ